MSEQELLIDNGGLEATAGTRTIYVVCGTVSLGLGIVGALLPVMPTTVFVLIAAWCYARGSRRAYERLIAHRFFGPIILDWQRYRAIPARARVIAISMIVVSFSISIAVVSATWLRVGLVACAIGLVVYLMRLPTRR